MANLSYVKTSICCKLVKARKYNDPNLFFGFLFVAEYNGIHVAKILASGSTKLGRVSVFWR